ncbi:helix-turn-helix protein [Pontibacter ummariensis]|uniref:Helix-turn-helix domain-containing protein n=1 Tax=Pontibacter ummariensis TaxID=1610492 RepID=A0A239LIT3_9BACT|nr:helix-turn-helix domain-containing protein [Pontibacter ummariensis]PRY03354.1 helix-turn-helix protein [Pontibacter ummariensis]SNT29808.1 Helix-turn-helix domain-containing protein [Pontibacter ummariensis]
MLVEIITKEDLQLFRRQLLEDLRQLLGSRQTQAQKQVLKSAEVRKLLKISPATLQTLRINGTLPFAKIGGTIYYRYEDIERLMDGKEARP